MPYRMVASPWVTATSKALGHFPPKAPLDKQEAHGLETGIAAVMYQEGMKMNAWFLLGSALLGIGAVRVTMYIDQKNAREERKSPTITTDEIADKLKAERERLADINAEKAREAAAVAASKGQPINGRPPPRVQVGGAAQNGTPQSSGEKKPITEQEAVSIIKW